MSKFKKIERVVTREVPHYWAEGRPARNGTGQYSTDGKLLYSYDLLVGDTCKNTGIKVLRDYSAQGRHGFQSMTTSKHIGYARPHADLVD